MLEHLRRLVVHLYPRHWRDRYGEEFKALLDDAPARWRDLPDLVKEALVAQTQNPSWKRIALASLAGLLVAAGISFFEPPQFASEAKIRASDSSTVPYLSMYVLSRRALAQVVATCSLYPNELPRLPLEDIVERMRRDIRVEPDPLNASEFAVGFRYPDASKAQAVVRELIASYESENQRRSMTSTLKHSVLAQITAPDLPIRSSRTFSPWTLAAGLALGTLAALILQQPFRRTLHLAAFALAGLIVVGAPLYLVNDRFLSTATIVARHAITAPPQSDVQIQEIPMPSDSPHVYRVSAIRTGQLAAQRALQSVIVALDPAIKEIVEPPTYPQLPISPNRLIPALWGATAALLYGFRRTSRHLYSATGMLSQNHGHANG